MPKAPKDLPRAEALKIAQRVFREGSVILRKHFRERLKERGISLDDIQNAFSRGKILKEPELDIKTNNWKYTVEGESIDGDSLGIVFALRVAEQQMVLITCFWKD